MEVKDRMKTAREIVEKNAKIGQTKWKEYYDQKAQELNLQAGDEVLLLLPSSTKKFVTKWQGPYTVIRWIGKVNYEIEIPDRRGHKQIFHVNHLSKWKERPCQVNSVIEDGEGIEEYQVTSSRQEIQFGQKLSEDKKEEIHRLLSGYPLVSKDTPGRTNRITHWIRTVDSMPIRQKPYRIP